MQRIGLTILVVALALAAACSEDRPTIPSDGGRHFLAGGGRQSDDDSLAGGPEGSGPGHPDFDLPNPDYIPLFYSDIDCQHASTQRVITNPEDWQTWWSAAIACIGRDGGRPRLVRPPATLRLLRDGVPGDSGVVVPDTTISPYPAEAPEVDFTQNVVITISIESDSTFGRGVWVQDVVREGIGTTVWYQVSHLGEDCIDLIMAPELLGPTSPTIAVMIRQPFDEPVTWEREDVTFNCTWEPDPNEPLTLYYTDADCELGPAEAVINDQTAFDSWLEAALACDQARWYDPDTQTGPGGDSLSTPPPLPPTWFGMGVDFTTHAVIVLRADSQDRWGGGVWLEGVHVANSGTTIDYTVMVPGDGCPVIGEGERVRPTAGIRVPLPLSPPIMWNRHTETIDCAWETAPGDSIRPLP